MTRVGRLSPDLLLTFITTLQAKPCWLALVTGDPFAVSDPLALEPLASVYSRLPVTWLRSGTLLRNRDPASWLGLPSGTQVRGVTGFDAATNGTPLFNAVVPLYTVPSTGGYYAVDAESLLVGF